MTNFNVLASCGPGHLGRASASPCSRFLASLFYFRCSGMHLFCGEVPACPTPCKDAIWGKDRLPSPLILRRVEEHRGPGLEENWRRPPFPWRVREPERPEKWGPRREFAVADFVLLSRGLGRSLSVPRSAVPDSTARDPSACHSFAMLAKAAKCASSKAFELEMTSALSVSLGTRRQWMMCASPIRALQAESC